MIFLLVLAKPQRTHWGSDTGGQQRCINSQRAAGFEDAASIPFFTEPLRQDDPKLTFRLTFRHISDISYSTAFTARFAFL